MEQIKRMWAGPWVPAANGRAPYLWLGSLVFLLWKYVYIRPGAFEAVALLLTLMLFVPLYFASYRVRGPASVLLVALTCLLGALWAPHNFGASAFFVFAAGMCAPIQPPRRAYLGVALVMSLGVLVAAAMQATRLAFLLPTLGAGIPVGIAGIMDATVRRAREQLLRKQEEVEYIATIAERERISRDLHDLLGHTLSLITLKAELAGKLLERDAAACMREIKDIETSARNALSEVRAAVSGYRQRGFTHELAQARASLAAAKVELQTTVQAFPLPAAAENVMALALREAVTNIVRHAGATRCELSLGLARDTIVFRIADNGTALADGGTVPRGNGLAGMHERVLALGGKLGLRVEQGLVLELHLPLGTPA